jgi:hypothetical protein
MGTGAGEQGWQARRSGPFQIRVAAHNFTFPRPLGASPHNTRGACVPSDFQEER